MNLSREDIETEQNPAKLRKQQEESNGPETQAQSRWTDTQ